MQYVRRVIKLHQDDLVVLYSDGASEAVNAAGTELGRDGLMSLAEGAAVQSAASRHWRNVINIPAFRRDDGPSV